MPTWYCFGRPCAVLAASALIAGCGGEATGVSQRDIASHRARWETHSLSRYRYDYRTDGFLNTLEGHTIELVVIDGAVQAATDEATGEPAPGPLDHWPTIDSLFDEATQASANGTLRGITYDPVLDYPSRIDLAGPPDASGSVSASGLQPAP